MTDRETRKLAQRIVRLERAQKAASGTVQLGYSSLEDRPINDYDEQGQLRSVIGRQHDGTHTVTVTAGPKPPTPSAPTVTTDFSTVTVRWDGVFCNPQGAPDATVPAPADWSRVEVHVSQEESAPTPSTARASIVAARGGEVTIRVPGGVQHVRLVSWSQAGRMSDPTPTVSVEVQGIGDMVRTELDAAETRLDAAHDILEAGQADLTIRMGSAEESLAGVTSGLEVLETSTLPELRGELEAAEGRLTSAESDITDAFGQIAQVPGQIDTATAEALAVAAQTAQAKADAAQAAAEEAARAYAEAIATGIEPVDLDALRQYMETKADQARQAAIDAAAIDAQARADAAQQAAEAKAQTAQQSADAARAVAESKASLDYILSRGTDLVTNGTGFMGNNTNFPGSVFDPANAPTGARGAFDYEGSRTVTLAETITVDPNRRYLFRFMAKQENPNITNSRFRSFVQPVDSAGIQIEPTHYWYQPETKTTLAADLKPGDRVATITGAWPNFPASQYRFLAAWNYADKWGKVWEYGTYTRNVQQITSVSGSTVTLNGAWSRPLVPAGTTVSTTRAGSTYMYIGAYAATMPTEWATFSGSTQSGVHDGTTGAAATRFPPGTAAVRLGFRLADQGFGVPAGEVSRSSIAMVSFSDVTQALQEGEQARAAADAAQQRADDAHTLAGSAQDAAVAAMDRAGAAETAAIEHADGLPKVLHGTTAPSGTAPDGSIWWQHQGALSGAVIGQWNRVNGQWVSTPVASDAIGNLDVGKLTAGAAEIAEVVAQRIASASGQFIELDVGQLTVTGTSALADVVAERIAAEVGEFLRLEVGQLIAGEGVMDEAVIQRLFAEVVVAGVSQAQAFIGENAILTGAVTAPKITASEELTAKIANFLTVQADHLAADAIDGMVITGAIVQTAPSGARVSLDGSALSVYDHEDDWRVRLSPEGSTFKGDLEAESLVANGPVEFKSTENIIASGAHLTLVSGVTDPTAPPLVQPYWDEMSTGLPEGRDSYGLAFADGKYWTYLDVPQNVEGDDLVSIDPTTGQLVDRIPMTDQFWAAYGVTAIGSRLYLLGEKSGVPYKAFVRVYETTGVFVREWEYTNIGHSPTDPLRFKPGIGTDGTNVVIAQCTDYGSLIWRIFNKDTGAIIRTVNCQDNTASDIRGVYIGPSDLGGTYTTVVKASDGLNATFTTSGTYDRDKSWFAETKKHTGLVFVDGHFRSLAPSGKITRFEGQATGDDSPDWWAAYRWETDIDGDNQLDYRSRISPPARFTWPRRARLKAIGAPLPVGVVGIGGFTAKKATRPTRQDFRRTLTHFRAGQPVALWHQYTGAGTLPSDENTYPLADPAIMRSASASFEVKGDGSGRWGPLTFHPDGTMTSSAVPAWIPLTTFKPGFGPATWGFAPAYRIWPDGKVEWRGVIAGSMSGTSVVVATVPTAARPENPVNQAGTISAGTSWGGVKRVEFSPAGQPADLVVYPTGDSFSWVSLDGLSYYLA